MIKKTIALLDNCPVLMLIPIVAFSWAFIAVFGSELVPEAVRVEQCAREFPGTFAYSDGRGVPICKYPDSTLWHPHWEYPSRK